MIVLVLVGVVSAVIGFAAGSYITWRGVVARVQSVLHSVWAEYYSGGTADAEKLWNEIEGKIRKVL
jgi:hypothetical protein